MRAVLLALLLAGAQSQAPGPNYDVPLHGKGSYVQTSDGRLYYEKEGSGPAVILVPGGPGNSHAAFHPWFSQLAKTHTVIYFDNIGRGRSDRLKELSRYTVRRDAEDIEALRKALGLDQIALIGHSYGGLPAMAYALANPQRVSHLVMSSSLHNEAAWQANIDSSNYNVSRLYPDVWTKLIEMRRKGVISSAREYQDFYAPPTQELYWYDNENETKRFRSGDPVDANNSDIYAAMIGRDPEWKVGGTLKGYNPSSAMRRMRTPTLIITGRADRVALPSVAVEMQRLIPGSRLEYFEKSGHRPFLEETDRYFELVGKFLAPR
jgi:proline iminopeptidase